MLLLSCIIGVIISCLGYGLASLVDGSISGSMVTVGGILFFIVWLIKTKWTTYLCTNKKTKLPPEPATMFN